MLTRLKIYFTFFILFGIIISCNQNSSKNGLTTDIVSNPASEIGDNKNKGNQPQFQFKEDVYDFGKITQGEKVSHSFVFKNTGGSDLLIIDAHGSCGCTVPRYPKAPIPSGKEGIVEVTFDSDGKTGKIEKSVTITANSNPNLKIIRILAQIEVPEDK